MINNKYILSSLCRNTNWNPKEIKLRKLPVNQWKNGDYITGLSTISNYGNLFVERRNGRMMHNMNGDVIIGALGVRHATLEATGSWRELKEGDKLQMLTGAGLIGKCTSKSFYIPNLIELDYLGHVAINDRVQNMDDTVPDIPSMTYQTPTIVMVGTSMTAGKTTAARIIIRQLVNAGLKVVGSKLTGAGRYRDILAMQDAGAYEIYDFVDVGLPSSIIENNLFRSKLRKLLSMIQSVRADIAVVEIGASPLEPYNGDTAINVIREHIKCVVLCASDPYAVYGVMKGFGLVPDLVSGIATNTIAGIELIEKLCGVTAINVIDESTMPDLRQLLSSKLGIRV